MSALDIHADIRGTEKGVDKRTSRDVRVRHLWEVDGHPSDIDRTSNFLEGSYIPELSLDDVDNV
jgi:hypothetical protein